MNTSRLVASAILAAAALPSLALAAGPAPVPTFANEKCYGVAAGGANDCGTASHSCAGQSSKAKDRLRGSTFRPVPARKSTAAASRPRPSGDDGIAY